MNGCFNRPPLLDEQVLHGTDSLTGEAIVVVIPQRNTTECQYTLFDKYHDKGCVGCVHQKPKG